jgi:hypothetical protein
LTYGEIEFASFAEQLIKVDTRRRRCRLDLTMHEKVQKYGRMVEGGGKFVDVGCGVGKAVFAAALLHAWLVDTIRLCRSITLGGPPGIDVSELRSYRGSTSSVRSA